jgi:hypothetical protein
MFIQHPDAARIAELYIGKGKPLEVLGWGVDGAVYTSPGAMTAVKIHKGEGSFERELVAYKRLRDRDVSEFLGFRVPKLLRFDKANRVIEMSIVKPPFLLDFAGTTTYRQFSGDRFYEWWELVQTRFSEEQMPTVSSVFHGLQTTFGLYYWDLKPGNLQFAD